MKGADAHRVVGSQTTGVDQITPVMQPAEEELEAIGDVVVGAHRFVVAAVRTGELVLVVITGIHAQNVWRWKHVHQLQSVRIPAVLRNLIAGKGSVRQWVPDGHRPAIRGRLGEIAPALLQSWNGQPYQVVEEERTLEFQSHNEHECCFLVEKKN